MSKAASRYKSLIGFAISGILLAIIAVKVDWSLMAEEFKRVDLKYLLVAFALFLLHFGLRAFRWRYLLPETTHPPSVKLLFDSMMVGNLATFLLPLRAGEFVRPFVLSLKSDYKFSVGFASIVVERFFDLITVLLTFVVLLYTIEGIPEWTHHGAIMLGGLALGIFLYMVIGSLAPVTAKRLTVFFTSKLPSRLSTPIDHFIDGILQGLKVLHSPKNLLTIIFLSLCVWGSCYLLFQSFLWAIGVFETLWLGITVAVIVALAVAAPSAPGFIGVFQVGCIAAMSLFGISEERALAYSIVNHGFHFIAFLIYGTIVLFRYNMKLSELSTSGRELAE